MPRAFITGISGQDGAYLARTLVEAGYKVFGSVRALSRQPDNLSYLGIDRAVDLHEWNYEAAADVSALLETVQPDLIFNLASVSSLSISEAEPGRTRRVNYEVPLRLFQTAIQKNPDVRIVQASSSLVFDPQERSPLTEDGRRRPDTVYGETKLKLDLALGVFRDSGAQASSAILFNHESPLRPDHFVSQKIVSGLVRRKLGMGSILELGWFDDMRDWSHADDVAKALKCVGESRVPGEFVVSSGQCHRVRDWLSLSSEAIGFKPEYTGSGASERLICAISGTDLAKVSPAFIRRDSRGPSFGSSAILSAQTGWKPSYTFEQLVEDMVRSAVDRLISRP